VGVFTIAATMYIVAIAWIYVVLLMSMTEHSIIAGMMTFLFYCIVPLTIILYLIGTPRRKQARLAAKNSAKQPDESSNPMEKSAIKSD
jgi:small-conductance mechanosensitive channel